MGDNTTDATYDALIHLLKNGIMVVALKEALAAKVLAIQSADAAAARVAAAASTGVARERGRAGRVVTREWEGPESGGGATGQPAATSRGPRQRTPDARQRGVRLLWSMPAG